jgi:ribosomal protein S18 acetylase RimI-like enzyme
MSSPFARIVGRVGLLALRAESTGLPSGLRPAHDEGGYPPRVSSSASIVARPFRDRTDLHAMQAAMSRAWAGPGRPFVPGTAGDLGWWTAQGGPDADWPSRIGLWEREGEVVAWGWFNPPGGLDWFVAGDLGGDVEDGLRGAILDWLAERARAHRAATVEPPAGPIELEAWAADGWAEEAVLRDRGWTATNTALSQFLQPLDVELDAPRVPDGYVLRHVRGPEEFPARVEAHRAAFAPSRLTVEKYNLLPGIPPYRLEHDLVVEAPDGSIAAFTICWLDPAGSIGEFEPVGTHPDHQRRGLGRVIMRAGLRLMREQGLRDALVFSLRANAASEALYRSAGFEVVAIHRQHTRSIDP